MKRDMLQRLQKRDPRWGTWFRLVLKKIPKGSAGKPGSACTKYWVHSIHQPCAEQQLLLLSICTQQSSWEKEQIKDPLQVSDMITSDTRARPAKASLASKLEKTS